MQFSDWVLFESRKLNVGPVLEGQDDGVVKQAQVQFDAFDLVVPERPDVAAGNVEPLAVVFGPARLAGVEDLVQALPGLYAF